MSDLSPTREPGRLLKITEVVRLTGLHRATIYRRIGAGMFPKPVHPGRRASRWIECDLNDWMLSLRE